MAMKSLWQAVRGRAAWFLLCVAAMALRASAASSRHCTAQHYVRISSDGEAPAAGRLECDRRSAASPIAGCRRRFASQS